MSEKTAVKSPGPESSRTDLMKPGQAEAAIEWARAGFPADQLPALQRVLGAPLSGVYDRATAEAVARRQKEQGLRVDGKAGPKTRSALGLPAAQSQSAPKREGAQGPAEPLDQGVSVALHIAKKVLPKDPPLLKNGKKPSNDGEFERRATTYAKQYHALGHVKGALVRDQQIAFSSLDELVGAIRAVHAALAPPSAQAARPSIKHLAIFTHGLVDRLMTQRKRPNFALKTDGIPGFAERIAEALAPDASVLLYACSTGKDAARKSETGMPKAGQRAGSRSFAARLARELQKRGKDKINVFSHSVAGHATENYCGRVFGAAAGGQEGGIHFFEVMYPDAFIQDVLGELIPDFAARSAPARTALSAKLRECMWAHYKDCLRTEHRRRDGKGSVFGKKTYLGMEAFQDPPGTAQKLHRDFKTRWLNERRRRALVTSA